MNIDRNEPRRVRPAARSPTACGSRAAASAACSRGSRPWPSASRASPSAIPTLVWVRTAADLEGLRARRATDPRVLGALLALEGAHALERRPRASRPRVRARRAHDRPRAFHRQRLCGLGARRRQGRTHRARAGARSRAWRSSASPPTSRTSRPRRSTTCSRSRAARGRLARRRQGHLRQRAHALRCARARDRGDRRRDRDRLLAGGGVRHRAARRRARDPLCGRARRRRARGARIRLRRRHDGRVRREPDRGADPGDAR